MEPFGRFIERYNGDTGLRTVSCTPLNVGAAWFRYGFAIAMLVTVLAGVRILNRRLEALEFETFIL